MICGQLSPSTQTIRSVIILPVELRWCEYKFLFSTNDGNIICLSGRSNKIQQTFKIHSQNVFILYYL